jgi:hypothetical protein
MFDFLKWYQKDIKFSLFGIQFLIFITNKRKKVTADSLSDGVINFVDKGADVVSTVKVDYDHYGFDAQAETAMENERLKALHDCDDGSHDEEW